ncbi:MAG TPA: extracellular solute-binding protein [Cellulomonas sp.]
MRMTKPAVLLAATALLSTALAGCSGSSGSEASESSGPADLRMTVWTSDEDQLALFQQIADAYVAAHPDEVSSVTFDSVPYDDYTTTLTTQIAGGNAPDLAWVFESSAKEFVASGALADLTDTLDATEGYDYDDIMPSTLDLWTGDDGDLYAYPFSNSPFVVFVNTDRLAEAGLDDPADLVASGQWTYDTVESMAADSVAALGGAGLVVRDFDYTTWSNLASVWAAWGADPWSADGSTCTFDSTEMVDAMTWFHDAVYEDGAIPEPGTTNDFFAGDTTFTITQISRASSLDGSFGWDVVPLPSGPAGQQNIVGQAGLAALSGGSHVQAAEDFLAYFTNAENSAELAQYFPSPRESLQDAETLAQTNPLLDADQLQVVVDAVQDAETKPSHANYAELDTAVRTALDALWTADADPETVLTDVCSSITPLLGS